MRVEQRHFRRAGSQKVYLSRTLSHEVIEGCALQNEDVNKKKKKKKKDPENKASNRRKRCRNLWYNGEEYPKPKAM